MPSDSPGPARAGSAPGRATELNPPDGRPASRVRPATDAPGTGGDVPTQRRNARDGACPVGTGDILPVIVVNHPALRLPAGLQRRAAETGFRISRDRTINDPWVDAIVARGRTGADIRAELTRSLAFYIPDPQVEVRIAAFDSQAVVVSGEVRTPDRQALTTVPLSLIEATGAASGFTDAADPRDVTVPRGGRVYPVDVRGFLPGRLTRNNPVLRNGDVVEMPRRRTEEAICWAKSGGRRR